MVRSVVEQAGADVDAMGRTAERMGEAVPDCLVTGYEPLVVGITLPDPNDRHVLAAAIRSGAEVIVTDNLDDFPQGVLDRYGIEAQSADDFVLNVIDLAPARVVQVISEQAAALRDPPMSVDEVLGHLERSGLVRSVAALRTLGVPGAG